MKKIINTLYYLIIAIISFYTLFSGPAFAAEVIKRVFIVHSYENGHICGQPQHDGAINALKEMGWLVGKNLDVSMYYMDTKKKNNTPDLIAAQGKRALKEIRDFKPDVVLTLDDNAFKTVGMALAGTSVPVVFCGMNVQPEVYNNVKPFMHDRLHPDGNITGVYEKLHIREAIKVLASIYEIKKTLILDDLSPTGRAISKQVELEINSDSEEIPLPCTIDKKTIHSWEEYKKTVEFINSSDEIGAFYLGTLLLKDAAGNVYTAKEIIHYTIEHAHKPAIGLNYSFIKLGLFGGASVDFYAMGKQAGSKVAKILSGAAPGTLAIDDAKKVALVFNLTRSKKLGIHIPPDVLLAADEVFVSSYMN